MNKYQDILKQWKVPEGKSTEQAWIEMQAKLSRGESTPKVIAFSWKPLISVAAAAAIIVGLVLLWPSEKLQTYECFAGQTKVLSLPDGSAATLNAGSSLTFADTWSDDRSVELQGQAFFEVLKGSAFRVVTPNGVVEVLGTSFDVFSRDEDFKVSCRTGRVRVSAGKQSVEIAPGFNALWEDGRLMVGEFNLAEPDWRNGEFIYENSPLTDVLNELSRQFDIEVQMPQLDNRFYTGRFSNKNLDEALQLICLPMGLKFEIVNEKRVVVADAPIVK